LMGIFRISLLQFNPKMGQHGAKCAHTLTLFPKPEMRRLMIQEGKKIYIYISLYF
jgi:hypothetical protein